MSKLYGSSTPRYGIYRKGNSTFYPLVEEMMDELGLTPFPWQKEVLKAIYAINRYKENGIVKWDWANRVVCISTGRQNGKGRVAEIVELADLMLFGASTVMHTAQGQINSRAAFKKMSTLLGAFNSETQTDEQIKWNADNSQGKEVIRIPARLSKKMLPSDFDPIMRRNLNAEKQEIKYVTRTGDKMLGNSVDCLIIDEAQLLKQSDWAEIFPTISARMYSHALLIGNPPANAHEEQFHQFREHALKSLEDDKESSIAWFEWSAQDTDDFSSPEVWAKAHPGYNYSISEDMFRDIYNQSGSLEDFQRQMLGMWNIDNSEMVIPLEIWREQVDRDSEFQDGIVIGLDIDYSGENAAIAIAGTIGDDIVKTAIYRSGKGTEWIVNEVSELVENFNVTAVIADSKNRINDMKGEFEAQDVYLTLTDYGELVQSCDLFDAGIRGGWLFHNNDLPLNLAIQGATWKVNAEGGMRRWDRKKSTAPIHALMACTLACWGVRMEGENSRAIVPVRGRVDPYAGRRNRIIYR